MTSKPALRILNQTRDRLLADQGELAASFWSRGRGLMGRSTLPKGYALVIYPEWSIHTFFMRLAIDVLFVSREHRIVGLCEAMPPNRPFAGVAPWRGRYVIELPAGVIGATGAAVGDQLTITPPIY
jgi:uncharacterized membrane protein (UPF0127 family)